MGIINVLIDLDRLKAPNNGLGQVALNLAEEISRTEIPGFKFALLVPPDFVGKFGNNVNYEVTSWKRRLFPFLCPSFDLWYTIHQDSWFFPSTRRTPYILTINDLNFLGEKKGLNRKYRLKRLQWKVNRASVITCISNYTRDQIYTHLDVKGKPVQVIYCGVTVRNFQDVQTPSYVKPGKLLFSIGVIQEKKNLAVLLDFMKELPGDYFLVMAGNKGGEYALQLEQRIEELGLNERVVLPGIISDEEKFWLYEHCHAVLFPSRFEGMGFPPVEAMRFGKPVFASTFSSIPEVSGDKAYYWTNFDPAYMAQFFQEKMEEFEADPERPAMLKEHSNRYTWKHNLEEYLELFQKVLAL